MNSDRTRRRDGQTLAKRWKIYSNIIIAKADCSHHFHKTKQFFLAHQHGQIHKPMQCSLTLSRHAIVDISRPTAILGLIFVSYIIILYLELSFAAIFEIIVQSVWPAVKASVVVAERFSLSVAAAMDSFEDIFQGAYCDMAELWCKHFHMMCSDRCSFFEMALERMRKTTPG
ncbi:hypothetical protein Tcan_08577 [Toxocara canis]|uniref:Uncharacterized protein n=1 Tax=Toxocara canis TaxID=6265 RepID=A0A0B2UZR6_TOXCA|nr:hypothetical protein Tcan_08577 [Toxocara canis]